MTWLGSLTSGALTWKCGPLKIRLGNLQQQQQQKAELTGVPFKAKAGWGRDVEFHSRSLDVKGKHTLRITSPERETNLPA